jgi:gas vesicle protein GvpG
MFFLDSLMISGISWTLRTVASAAEAELSDDTVLREQLIAADMQRESGEISDADYREIERDLLARIREIKERRDGGAGPLGFGERQPLDTASESRVQVEAVISGDFHEPSEAPHTTVVDTMPQSGGIIGTRSASTTAVLDVQPVRAETVEAPALPLPSPARPRRKARPARRRPSGRSRALRSKIRRS